MRALRNGRARIRLSAGDRVDTVTVDVALVATGARITPGTARLTIGDRIGVEGGGIDSAGAVFPGAFEYSSSDPAVATVDGSGVVGAVGNGSTTITVFGAGFSASAVVSVPVEPLRFRSLSIGSEATCGVTVLDEAYCWGWGNLPFPVLPGRTYRSVTMIPASDALCGLALDSTLYCGMFNPVVNANGFKFGQYVGSCAILADGMVNCASFASGSFWPGRRVAGPGIVALSGRHWHWCGVNDQQLAFCWGANRYGGVGNGSNSDVAEAVPVVGGHRWLSVSAGSQFTCGVTTSGVAFCWGSNTSGRLGLSQPAHTNAPLRVPGAPAFQSVVAGEAHACGLTPAGAAHCWGNGSSGQLGDGTFASTPAGPRRVVGNLEFVRLAAGASATCGVTTSGGVYCWGGNHQVHLGDGTSYTLTPTPVHILGTAR